MLTIRPVRRALLPVDSDAAERISAPNYDEFQSDAEIRARIEQQPESVLKVTMPHCDPKATGGELKEGSPSALDRAAATLAELQGSALTQTADNVMWVYEIETPSDKPAGRKPQIGLGALALTSEIRTDETPDGTIIRNEGIRPPKAKGRADLIARTDSYIGTVNTAIEDSAGTITAALDEYAAARRADFETPDEVGNVHRVWLVRELDVIARFVDLFAAEPFGYVADGNHRSAAAAMLGKEEFLTVFFGVQRLAISPYNRLVRTGKSSGLVAALSQSFAVAPAPQSPYQPLESLHIGVYADKQWFQLRPQEGTFDPADAAQSIDADIVQRRVFDDLLGLRDPKDDSITFVGGDRPASYLQSQVDSGAQDIAITLPPVTMQQFMDVCRQNRFMPPKSTWFEPKVRSGLVIALLDASA